MERGNARARHLERAQQLLRHRRQLGRCHGRQIRRALLRHALSHSGFRYSVLSHQNSHGVSHQTARSDLQKLATRGLLTAGKDWRQEVFRVPEDLAMRLPG